ncbi:MAG TPA: DegQ family serine endoprotease [Acetobacteraceae bacterium]|jgi:serine protease Do|nr:DegQ family serine endoprotease [Acetobacteraceae bacterium]
MSSFPRPVRRLAVIGVTALLAAPVLPVLVPAARARPAPDSFADLAATLLPGVVNISSSTSVQARADRSGPGTGPEIPMFPPGSPFEQFFHDFMDRQRPNGRGGDQPQEPRRMQSLGSGFIIDAAGYVVTNNHVIDGADEITVILQDNTKLKATLIGRDEKADIALLKVASDKPLPAVKFGDSNAERVGDWVLAIGNPFGLGGSVTAGIVSARGRDIGSGPYDDYLQTDAAINKGNSGGPLFNMDGDVIGMNTAIYSPSGGSIGIGFSIPSNIVKNVVEQLRDYGHARRGWLGVQIQSVTPDIAESLGLHDPRGALVAGVDSSGPAAKAQLKNGDIILKFNNEDIKDMHALPRVVAEAPIGVPAPVTVWRDGKEQVVSVTIGELPDRPQLASAKATDKPDVTKPTEISGLGLRIAPITPETRDRYQIGQDQKGVVITDVTSGTPAGDQGLKPGDVIVEVQQQEVKTPSDVIDKVDGVRKTNRASVLMLVQTQDGLHWVPLSLKGNGRQPG